MVFALNYIFMNFEKAFLHSDTAMSISALWTIEVYSKAGEQGAPFTFFRKKWRAVYNLKEIYALPTLKVKEEV